MQLSTPDLAQYLVNIWVKERAINFEFFSVKGIQGVIISRNIANIKQKSNWEKLANPPRIEYVPKAFRECDDYF